MGVADGGGVSGPIRYELPLSTQHNTISVGGFSAMNDCTLSLNDVFGC